MRRLLFPPKKLIICTALVFVGILVIFNVIKKNTLPTISKNVTFKEFPTLGNVKAPVHIVIFEEPSCTFCKEFNQYVFPDIKTKYIDTGIASYSLVITSFFPASDLAAEALLCVYNSNPTKPDASLFFEYLKLLFQEQLEEGKHWITTELLANLLDKMTNSNHVTKEQLKSCLENRTYSEDVKNNNKYGANLMNGELATPTIFINGFMLKEMTFESVSGVISTLLEKQKENNAKI